MSVAGDGGPDYGVQTSTNLWNWENFIYDQRSAWFVRVWSNKPDSRAAAVLSCSIGP